jgi:hypothetical protein
VDGQANVLCEMSSGTIQAGGGQYVELNDGMIRRGEACAAPKPRSDIADDPLRRVSPVAPRPREGLLTEPTAGAQPWPRERVLMPRSGPLRQPRGLAWSMASRPSMPVEPVGNRESPRSAGPLRYARDQFVCP